MSKELEIGAYEAKTNLAAFLRKVQSGGRFTITQRGRPVAELVPYGTTQQRAKTAAATQMQAFMRKHQPVTGIDIKTLIEEGRD